MFFDGYVEEINFDIYELLWIFDMLEIDVYIVQLIEVLIGIGELGILLIGLVVVNVIVVVKDEWVISLLLIKVGFV